MQAKSRKGRTVNALAYSGDEGRAKLRKAAGSCKEALIRGYPNGATPSGFGREILTNRLEGELWELKHLSTRRRRKQQ
jgi:hypothetical protein